MSKVFLTQPQIKALMTAANAMLAGEEGEGDFLCRADVLDRAVDALAGVQSSGNDYQEQLATLRAELARVTEERDRLRSLVQALLDGVDFPVDGRGFYCPWCEANGYKGQSDIKHPEDCPYKQARAALNSTKGHNNG